MAKKKYETQFSIYKVDFERSIKYFEEEYDTKILSYSELEDQILNTIKKEISNRKKNERNINSKNRYHINQRKTF